MAEFVQQSIEEMLPELEQMERVGLFQTNECRSILKKRKALEYKLRRRTKQKSDFLQYIQYEMNVLALVRKRRNKTGYKFKRMEIDVAIVQRIHNLFRLCCYRFQDDVKLWLSHVEFCKKQNEKYHIAKVFTRMLQVHNKKPELWIAAAKWEAEDNKSMENARNLLQRGLRFNPLNQKLWTEYFRMELLNAEKLRKRREVLGVTEDTEEVGSNIILEGRIAEIVYNKAVENIAEDVHFHIALITVCRCFPFTASLQDTMYKNLQFHHGEREIVWDAVARRGLKSEELSQKNISVKSKVVAREVMIQESACCKIYEAAVKKLNTESMWDLYIKFCLERLNFAQKATHKLKLLEQCQNVCEAAQHQKHVSANMYAEWLSLLELTGQTAAAVQTCEMAVHAHPTSPALWHRYLSILVSTHETAKFRAVMEQALTSVPEKESLPIWEIAIQWSVLNESEKAESLFERGISGCREVCIPIKVLYLKWACVHQNVHFTRKLYSRLAASQPLSLDFFYEYLTIENAQAEPKMKYLRRAYEDACREFGASEPDLWLAYVKVELTHNKGRPENAGTLHWRALKALQGSHVQEFVSKYTLLQSGQY